MQARIPPEGEEVRFGVQVHHRHPRRMGGMHHHPRFLLVVLLLGTGFPWVGEVVVRLGCDPMVGRCLVLHLEEGEAVEGVVVLHVVWGDQVVGEGYVG